MNKNLLKSPLRKLSLSFMLACSVFSLTAQNVFDDIIATSPNHTILEAAILEANIQGALQNGDALTVFAPTDDAFMALADQFGVEVEDLLDLPDLTDILFYHVLELEAPSSSLTNGQIVQPINASNTIKLTVTEDNMVFANQAMVNGADLTVTGGNGVVHSVDAVLSSASTVVDIALSTGVHNVLVSAVVEAELLPVLTAPYSSLTVFAPTDDAFTAALGELGLTAEELLASEDLAGILTYHVLGSAVTSDLLMNGMLVDAVNDANTIKVTVGESGVFVNQAEVTGADNLAGNGVVHVTNGVILPTETVVDVALSTGVHGTLVAAVIEAELLPALSNPFAQLTVFAPTDDAFTAALGELGLTAEELLASEDLASILTYHVLDGSVLSSSLMNGMTPTPLNDANSIKVAVGESGVFVNQAEVTGADNETGNGVVHVTNGVILPTETVVDVAISTGIHNTLVAAVIEAELLPALSDPFATLTVFAPTDDAFTALLSELDLTAEELLEDEDLGIVLAYHVLGQNVLSTDLMNGMLATPLYDENTLKVTVGESGVFINQAEVTGADNETGNGVVHITNDVLLPVETVVDVALSTGEHNILVQAVATAELLPALTDPNALLTVFAPTDNAFTAALGELGLTAEELLASEDLAGILTYHVLGDVVLSGDLMNGMLVDALNDANTIKVTVGESGVFVNQAEVTGADNTVDNGTVHVINEVILPAETIADTVIDSPAHNTLELALVTAELLPAVTDPFTELTLFAPTDAAFVTALTELGISATELLEGDGLTNILLYHVVAGTVLSTDLENGNVETLSTEEVIVNVDNGAMINNAMVETPNLESANGVVHVIDAVLLSTYLSVDELAAQLGVNAYPNPTTDVLFINADVQVTKVTVRDTMGRLVKEEAPNASQFSVEVSDLEAGQYFVTLSTPAGSAVKKLIIE